MRRISQIQVEIRDIFSCGFLRELIMSTIQEIKGDLCAGIYC